MSQYQMQKCLFDYLRAKKHAPPDQKPDVSVEGYDLTDEERKVVETLDVQALRWAPSGIINTCADPWVIGGPTTVHCSPGRRRRNQGGHDGGNRDGVLRGARTHAGRGPGIRPARTG